MWGKSVLGQPSASASASGATPPCTPMCSCPVDNAQGLRLSGSKSPTRELGGEHHSVAGHWPVQGSSLHLASPHVAPECWRHRVRDEGEGAKLVFTSFLEH